MVLFVLIVVFTSLFLSGIYQLLNAVWELRQGADKNAFVMRGMLGFLLVALSFVVPYIVMMLNSFPR